MTGRPARFHRAAQRELRRAVDRYDEQVRGLGEEFAAEVERTVDLIVAHPDAGTPHLAGTRRAQTRRFPYSVVYIERGDRLVILAVAHHGRSPEYWLRRV